MEEYFKVFQGGRRCSAHVVYIVMSPITSTERLSEPFLRSSELEQRMSSLLSSIRRPSSDSLGTTEDIEGSLDEYL